VLELQLIATGMHLSPEFGLTVEAIEADGFQVDRKVEILLSSDTAVGVTKSMGLGLIGVADALAELKPDLVLVLGDRYEIFCAAAAAMIARIPIAHLHGGETTQGAFDEAIRHIITKMSHLHFVAAEDYRRRVIQLGEQPDPMRIPRGRYCFSRSKRFARGTRMHAPTPRSGNCGISPASSMSMAWWAIPPADWPRCRASRRARSISAIASVGGYGLRASLIASLSVRPKVIRVSRHISMCAAPASKQHSG
jgi:hypothetical protein